MRLALHQPDQAGNVGTILRLAACLGVPLDLIEPCGFPLADRALKRAGMDYAEIANVTRHSGWEAFEARLPGRLVLFTTARRRPPARGALRAGRHLALRLRKPRRAGGGARAGGHAGAHPAGRGDALAEPRGGGGDRAGGGGAADGVVGRVISKGENASLTPVARPSWIRVRRTLTSPPSALHETAAPVLPAGNLARDHIP